MIKRESRKKSSLNDSQSISRTITEPVKRKSEDLDLSEIIRLLNWTCIFNIMKAIIIQQFCITVSTSCYVYGSLFGIIQNNLVSDIDTITKYGQT